MPKLTRERARILIAHAELVERLRSAQHQQGGRLSQADVDHVVAAIAAQHHVSEGDLVGG